MAYVFDIDVRRNNSRADRGEPHALFLNRVADDAFERVRDLVEAWLDHVPSEGNTRAELAVRLRSSDNRAFLAAFWELYLHESFFRLRCAIEGHPPIPGSSRSPDWLVEPQSGRSFFLEATAAAPRDADDDPRTNELLDAINRPRVTDFRLGVEVLRRSVATPSAKRILKVLNPWLESLDPDDVWTDYERGGFSRLPIKHCQDGGWELTFRAIPRRRPTTSPIRPLGLVGPGPVRVVDPVGPVLRALKEKATRYGELDRPYVIALSCVGTTVDSLGIQDALFGGPRMTLHLDRDELEEGPRTGGFWIDRGRPRNTRVSAVVVVHRLLPWTVATAQPYVFHNPWATRPFEGGHPWATATLDIETSTLEKSDAPTSPRELFELDAGWPGQPRLT